MTRLTKLLALTLLLLTALPLGAQETVSEIPIRVYVRVNGTSPIAEQLLSYVSRGLRSLGDVEVVQENQKPDFTVRILAEDLTVFGARTPDVYLSVVVTSPLSVRGVRFAFCDLSSLSTVEMVIMLNKGIDKPSAASLLAETLVVIQAHAMMVGTNVKVVSERLVTYVDSDVLEVHRKIEAGVYAPVKE